MNLRLVMAGASRKPMLQPLPPAEGAPAAERMLRAFFDGDWHDVPLYTRAALRAGQCFAGPAVVAQDDATVCIPPGYGARVDAMGNILLELVA